MAKKNVVMIRFDGTADQLECAHVSAETKKFTGTDAAPVVVLPRLDSARRAEVEAELGHKLTDI